MTNSTTPEVFGAVADQLVTLEARVPAMRADVMRPLLEAARAAAGGKPVSLAAAEGLMKSVDRGDCVLVLSGAGTNETLPYGETDGPAGAAAIARALFRGLGAVPVFVAARNFAVPIVAASKATGLNVKSSFENAHDWHTGAAVASPPDVQADIPAWAAKLFDELHPKAVLATECIGAAKDGYLHLATGPALNGPHSRFTGALDLSAVFTEANARGIFSVGVGDWGNELGFGTIWEAVARHVDNGETMATTTKADVVVPAATSNWGCYGIEACLAYLLRRPDLMHTADEEERILRASIAAGALESISCTPTFAVDGLEGEAGMAIVQLLGCVLREKLGDFDMSITH
jgi:D-glutamate cyclase